jgi:hypothetical protein
MLVLLCQFLLRKRKISFSKRVEQPTVPTVATTDHLVQQTYAELNQKNDILRFFMIRIKKNTTHFGYSISKNDIKKCGSTYIDHKNNTLKDAYIARHKVNEDFKDYMSAGSLSRYILWNKKSLRESIADYKRRFSLE